MFLNNLTQNLTTIGNTLTDIAVSTIDTHNPEVIADGKETGHMISSGLGAVGGAALGGGNVGATAAGVVAGDLVNGLASDASKQLANKISPDQKNKNDANSQDRGDAGQVGKVTPNDNKDQQKQTDSSKNQTYDTTTDINKVVSGIAGIIFGGGNVGLDATAGGITSLKVAPKIDKPKDQKVEPKVKDKQPEKTGEPNVPTK